jgi:hypothetical protein
VAQEAAVPQGFWARVQKMIDDSIAKYARSGPLRNATITEGALTIQNGVLRILYPDGQGGGAAVYYGNLVSGEDGSTYLGTGMLVQAPDGTDIASFSWDATGGGQTAHLHDAQNNIIVGNDKISGQGLAYPLIPAGFHRTRFNDFDVSTTSSTFETLWDTRIYKQQPRLLVGVRASMDTAGTTGELRILVNGVPLGSVAAQIFGVTTNIFGPAAVAGAHTTALTIEVQGRRTSASGVLKVEPLFATGFPS